MEIIGEYTVPMNSVFTYVHVHRTLTRVHTLYHTHTYIYLELCNIHSQIGCNILYLNPFFFSQPITCHRYPSHSPPFPLRPFPFYILSQNTIPLYHLLPLSGPKPLIYSVTPHYTTMPHSHTFSCSFESSISIILVPCSPPRTAYPLRRLE